MKKRKIYIFIIFISCLIALILFSLLYKKDEKDTLKKLDLNKTSFNFVVNDNDGMMLYRRFQPEDGLLFDLIGSDSFKDYYAYYFKKNKTNTLSNFVKNIVLLTDADYTKWNFNKDNNCYEITLDDYKVVYDKLFNDNNLKIDFDNEFIVANSDDNKICVEERFKTRYTKVLDTYLVNIVRLGDKIIVYERIAFIKITDKKILFYDSYKMNNQIYSLNIEKSDMSFINNSKVVSNVLLQYQDKFPLYQYTYSKGIDTYYLESIEK